MNHQGQTFGIEVQDLRWRQALLLDGKPFPWHRRTPPSAKSRDVIVGPQVYRWTMRNRLGGVLRSYIGEAEKFENRLCAYRNGETKIRTQMNECEKDGGTVELHFLDLGSCAIRINGKPITNRSLADHDMRLMMEKLAIVIAHVEGVKLLNVDRGNVCTNDLRTIIQEHPEVRPQLLRTYHEPSM